VKTYFKKLKISGFHIEISEFRDPIYIGGKRDEESILEGVEKRKRTKELKEQMNQEIEEFVRLHPNISVTNNPEHIADLNKIRAKYEVELKSREDNNKRKITALRDKIQSNYEIWTHFITLTFKDNVVDLNLAKERLKDWTKKMKKIFPEFQYIYVTEFHQSGGVHFHVICSMDPGKKVSPKKFNETRHTWNWGSNTSGIDIKGINYKYIPKNNNSDTGELKPKDAKEKIQTIWSVGNYLTSYLKKDANATFLFGSKMYGSSTGLKTVIEITDIKKIAELELELGLANLKEKVYEVEIPETGNKVTKKYYNKLILKTENDTSK
jgi:hypothetical protein